MSFNLSKILSQEKKKRNIPLEIKKIGNNYYLYHSTTVWLKEKKKRKKKSVYIGKITSDGVIEGLRKSRVARSIYEYGNYRLLYELSKDIIPLLKKAFSDEHNEIIAMGMMKVMQDIPIKMMEKVWEKVYLSTEISASLSPNSVSKTLKSIGSDWDSQMRFYKEIMGGDKHFLFDMSSIVSYSENLRMAEKGYNAEHHYLRQINFILVYSVDRGLPVMIKAMEGSIRDIKALKQIIKEYGIKGCRIILDRGFSSYNLVDIMEEREVKYILPLKRNSKMIDYEMKMGGSFTYEGRGIKWGKKSIEGGRYLYLYEDVKLRGEEETTYISLIEEGKREKEGLEEEGKRFGKISILTNEDGKGDEIYKLYKQREMVEVAFDAMKNEMENDKTYLSDDDAVRGYFFIAFISLYLYFRVLEEIRKKGLTGKISVKELLFELSKVYLVNYSDGRKMLSEIPERVEKLAQTLELDIFPKTLRS